MDITIYTVENKVRETIWNEATSPFFGEGVTSEFEQLQHAKEFALAHNGLVIANEFEFSDSFLVFDYSEPEGHPMDEFGTIPGPSQEELDE
jgi:hypothetical protein